MSPRASRSKRPAAPVRGPGISPESPCPCGLPAAYGLCCGRFHAGEAHAATCEQLMRSRYAAFVTQDADYLLRTWLQETRPPSIAFDPALRWQRLEILDATDGTAFHRTGTVTFRAHFTDDGTPGTLHEKSAFVRHEGPWVYARGVFID
ncbi:YchJ family protein [uncultured Streptomyces sp.]|uniref:YchJ family protein n=1 Tax=uncultured Streptomyces sp. TaxID=174707 RepID=UPI00262FD7AF|nr:YchJ family metal-binding protein [uncultured Streptomyces sp.]